MKYSKIENKPGSCWASAKTDGGDPLFGDYADVDGVPNKSARRQRRRRRAPDENDEQVSALYSYFKTINRGKYFLETFAA